MSGNKVEYEVSLDVGGRVLIRAINYNPTTNPVLKSASDARDSAAEFFEDAEFE